MINVNVSVKRTILEKNIVGILTHVFVIIVGIKKVLLILPLIVCEEIVNFADGVSINVTNNISTNVTSTVSINYDDKK